MKGLALLLLFVTSLLCLGVAIGAPQGAGVNATSTVTVRADGKLLCFSAHEAGAAYEIDGGLVSVTTVSQGKQVFTASNGGFLLESGGQRFEVPEVRVLGEDNHPVLIGWVAQADGGGVEEPVQPAEPKPEFAPAPNEANGPAGVGTPPKPKEPPSFRVQPRK